MNGTRIDGTSIIFICTLCQPSADNQCKHVVLGYSELNYRLTVYSLTSLRAARLFPALLPHLYLIWHRSHIVDIDNVWYPH